MLRLAIVQKWLRTPQWSRSQPRCRRTRLELEALEAREVPAGVVPTYTVTSDWGSGFQADLQLANQQASSVPSWRLEFDLAASISSIWNAQIVSHTGNHYVISGVSWDKDLAANGSVDLGFVASPGGVAAPLNYLIDGVPGGTTTPPPVTPPPPAGGGTGSGATNPNVQFQDTSDWGSGFNGQITVNNSGSTTLNHWSLAFTMPAQITSLWDGSIVSHSGNQYVVDGADWDNSIAAGGSVSFGFTATPGGVVASNFALNGTTSGTSGAGTGGSTGATANPAPAATAPWPNQVFAPYVDATLYPTFNFVAAAQNQGIKYFTLAFIVADGNNQPSWGGYSSYEVNGGAFDTQLRTQIGALRALGGDVMVSFGGANGQELAQAITNVPALTNAYQSVVNAYNLTQLDFDIEGAAAADHASIDRRSQALATLQQSAAAAGKPLSIWFTLPVLPSGLTSDGLYVLQSALKYGVNIAGVNVMAMDYGDGAAPNPQGQMGQYAIESAQSLFGQLQSLYGPAKTTAQLWHMVGVSPMIGVNDLSDEVFNQAAAQQLLLFAEQVGMGRISMWSLNRDQENPAGALTYAEATSSSLVQQPFAFSLIFEPFTR